MKIQQNISLAQYTTFKIGGQAKFFILAKSIKDVREAMAFADQNKLPVFVLGGGSNILIDDKGFDGLVVKIEIRHINWLEDRNHVFVLSGAGVSWDKLVGQAVAKGLGGIENLSLIPGTVGGAVYQNIGAYGTELKDVLTSVQVFDLEDGQLKKLSNQECRFGYRDSIFKKENKKYIILAAELKLSRKHKINIQYPDLMKFFHSRKPTIHQVRRAVIRIRKYKLPYDGDVGSAGSFFKNPVVSEDVFTSLAALDPEIKGWLTGGVIKLSAAQLIDKAGFKGYRLNNVGISTKHALVLVNYKNGKFQDVTKLANKIQAEIMARYRVNLEPEVEIIKS